MTKRELEALLGRAPYEQPDKMKGAERLIYVNDKTKTAYILRFVNDKLNWTRETSTTADWPNASMRR